MTLIYLAGLLPRSYPVFGVNPGSEVLAISVWGLLGTLFGYSLSMTLGGSRVGLAARDRASPRNILIVRSVMIGALSMGFVNYATGEIPIFSANVNGARFSESAGLFASYWFAILAVAQVAVIHSFVSSRVGVRRKVDLAIGAAALVLLALSGARALLVLPFLACALIYVEWKRPPLGRLAMLGAGGVAMLGAVGLWRVINSAGSTENIGYLGARGQANVWGVLDTSAQAGPRALERLIQLGGPRLNGEFLAADAAQILFGSTPSDRIVTELLGGDPALVGGTPPTGYGGLFLDWGFLGVAIGSVVVGLLVGWFHLWHQRRGDLASTIGFGYLLAYVAISAYSYFSLKPSLLIAMALSFFLWFGLVGRAAHTGTKPSLERSVRR